MLEGPPALPDIVSQIEVPVLDYPTQEFNEVYHGGPEFNDAFNIGLGFNDAFNRPEFNDEFNRPPESKDAYV